MKISVHLNNMKEIFKAYHSLHFYINEFHGQIGQHGGKNHEFQFGNRKWSKSDYFYGIICEEMM